MDEGLQSKGWPRRGRQSKPETNLRHEGRGRTGTAGGMRRCQSVTLLTRRWARRE